MKSTNKELENSIDEMKDEILERDSKDKIVLANLLDKFANQKGKVFALRSTMGISLADTGTGTLTPSFVVTHDLDWIGKNMKMGSQMPFMEHSIDKEGRIIVDASNAHELKQRVPDWTRQPALAAYLAHDNNRKFGTILAVISPSWVDNPSHENWGPNGKSLKNAHQFEALDSEGNIGLLNLNDYHVYALDGQHRVMGIRGVQNIRDDSKLNLKKKDGTPKNKVITKEEFLKEFNLDVAKLQSLLSEKMNVEYIPSVLAGETREMASRRVRSVFVAINSYAKKPDKGENILLDESDGYAIVARKAGVLHSLFSSGEKVNWKNTSLPRRTSWYTTLQALKDMASGYLIPQDEDRAHRWAPHFSGQVPIRPDEENLKIAEQEFFEFLDQVQQIPVFRGLASGNELDDVREFPDDKNASGGHLLLRPIGQTILARAIGQLIHEGYDLKELFKKLSLYDESGGFEAHKSMNVWSGITYDGIKKKMIVSNQELAVDLLKYLLRGAKDPDRKDLLLRFVEARTVKETQWINYDGDLEKIDLNKIKLPLPI